MQKLLNELNREGVRWSKQSLKDRCNNEALFLRALYYFNLVLQFGGIPLLLRKKELISNVQPMIQSACCKKTFLYPKSYALTANKLLAPIPVNEISINKLEQNPGY